MRSSSFLVALLGAAFLAACAAAGGLVQRPAQAASSGTVVAAVVPSAISLADQCHAKAAWSFGTVLPGSASTTATGASVCRFTWSSTNDSSMIRIQQADRTGAAMQGQATAWTQKTATGTIVDLSGKGSTYLFQGEWAGQPYYRSLDAGATFSPPIASAGTYISVSVVDSTTAWRAGGSGVQRTTNLDAALPSPGPSWTTVSGTMPGTCASPGSISAVSASTAWVLCNGMSYRTSDGGATWSSGVDVNVSNPPYLEAVSATTAYSIGWGRVSRSNDSNASWTLLGSALTGRTIVGVSQSPASATVAWAVDADGRAYRTGNTGTAWTALTPPPERFDAWGLEAVSDTSAIVHGTSGIAYRTTDTGATWTRLRTPLNGTLHQVVALDSTHIMVTSYYANAYVTANGGSTWTAVNSVRDAPSDTAATDAQTILTSDSNGRVRLTTNGGTSWSACDTGLGAVAVRGVALHASGTGASDAQLFAVADGGGIAVSRDGGSTWQRPASGTGQDLWDIEVRSDGVALAVGGGGTILRSTDWGSSWTSVGSAGASLYAVELHPSGLAIAVGVGGLVRRSTDSGATWSTPASSTTTDLVSLDIASSTVVYASGTDKLVKSVDGGATWSTVSTSGGVGVSGFSRVAAASEDTVWLFMSSIAGWDPNWAARSVDGGATWQRPFPSQMPEVLSPVALDTGAVLLPAEGGHLRITNPTATVADYSAGAWAGGTSRFGVCLQALGGSAAAGSFPVDGNGTCTASDSDPWNAVPAASPAKVGQMVAAGTGSIDLVWGMRAGSSLAAGEYTAGIVVTAVAPNA